MKRFKVPGRKIGKVYKVCVINGIPHGYTPDTLYPYDWMNNRACDRVARPTSDDPEFGPYDDGIDKDGRNRMGMPVKREQEPNLQVMLRRIFNYRHITVAKKGGKDGEEE